MHATGEPARTLVADPRFERLVPRGSVIRRLADGFIWAEGPVWLPDEGALLWSDIPNNRVLRWAAADGTVTDHYRPSDFANGHTLDHDGTVLACQHGTRGSPATSATGRGRRSSIATRASGSTRRTTSSSRPTARSGSPTRPTGSSVIARATRPTPNSARATSSGSTRRPATWPSSAATSSTRTASRSRPTSATLYVSDTSAGPRRRAASTTSSRSTSSTAAASHGRECSRVIDPGAPDGFRVDVEGNVWTSAGDGLHVLAPDGTELGGSCCPRRPPTARSAGPDGRTLFITATSTLWSIEVGIRGAVTPWAG